MDEVFICKIASFQEMNIKWNYEIAQREKDKDNWIVWKKRSIENYERGYTIPYYGILEGNIICEATAMVHPKAWLAAIRFTCPHSERLTSSKGKDIFQSYFIL